MSDLSKSQCPECGEPVAQALDCPTWCPACNWNLAPGPAPPQGTLATIYRDMGARLGGWLFDSLRTAAPEAMKPRLTASVALAFAVAGLVHLTTVALLVLGLWLIWVDWFNWFLGLGGLLMVTAAWALAPKPAPAPEHPLTREKAPALYRLADSVAEALGADPVDSIGLMPDINAFMGKYGWRQRSLLLIGAPLWLCLDARQKLALVAHELAHEVNGDYARSFWIVGAVNALGGWLDFLRQPYSPNASLGEILGHYMTWLLSIPIGVVYSLLIHLFWQESQRAEYLADHLGSRVSGSDAYTASDDRILLAISRADDLIWCLRRHADAPERAVPAFAARVKALPEIETERLRRASEMALTSLDATHPPSFYRVELVRAFPCAAAVEVSEEDAARLDEEVLAHCQAIGRDLVRTNLHSM
ncbi:MAG TPA: M48 family metalloprotease [Thermohalobaculum sp.]|nr:M48 family metalloprotease [Thermohalobaculum sp.]